MTARGVKEKMNLLSPKGLSATSKCDGEAAREKTEWALQQVSVTRFPSTSMLVSNSGRSGLERERKKKKQHTNKKQESTGSAIAA